MLRQIHIKFPSFKNKYIYLIKLEEKKETEPLFERNLKNSWTAQPSLFTTSTKINRKVTVRQKLQITSYKLKT